MAALIPTKFSQLMLKVETTAGVYIHHCLINGDRSLSETTNFTETIVPDCDDADAPGIKYYDAESQDLEFSGTGKVDLGSLDFYAEWSNSGLPKNVKAEVAATESGGQTYTGEAIIESFEYNGTYKQLAEVTVSGRFTGTYVRTATP